MASAGCSSADLRRLAPPGIIRYEKIADEKPPNPVIEQRVKAYGGNRDAVFPKIGETLSSAGRPSRMPAAEVDREIETLSERRDRLQADVEAERRAADEREAELDAIRAQGETLRRELESQKDLARRERAAPAGE